MGIDLSVANAANQRSATAPRPSAWQRFTAANKRFCHTVLQPRIYTLSHVSAIDWWLRRRVESLPVRGRMLEFGCGHDFPMSTMVGDCFDACEATDIEDVPLDACPPGVTFTKCSDATLPFDSSRFDAVLIRSVLEHVADPPAVFNELARVLKPGGYVLLNLPNKWDYVSVISRCAGPLKSQLLHGVLPGAWDDFPVYYRCNTRRSLTQALRGTGLAIEQFRPMPSEPGCLKFFVPLYLAGAIYQFAISILALDFLQPSFLVILRKDASA